MINLKLEVSSFGQFMEHLLEANVEGVYLAGGAVRNAFINPELKAKDLDIFITRSAFDQIKDHLKEHGKLSVNQFKTYRWYAFIDDEFYYDIIIIPEFYNGLWKCRNITDALNQFDITANALAFDLFNGIFYDPQNGLLDIQQRILRAVRFDYPEIAVSNDITLSRNTVLWFRYYHYAKKLNFTIDPITKKWLKENDFRKHGLAEFTNHFFSPSLSL